MPMDQSFSSFMPTAPVQNSNMTIADTGVMTVASTGWLGNNAKNINTQIIMLAKPTQPKLSGL